MIDQIPTAAAVARQVLEEDIDDPDAMDDDDDDVELDDADDADYEVDPWDKY